MTGSVTKFSMVYKGSQDPSLRWNGCSLCVPGLGVSVATIVPFISACLRYPSCRPVITGPLLGQLLWLRL